MRKQEFLEALRAGLSGLPQEDIEERLSFYSEMIDDRMEEGLTEEEAVAGVGSVDEIVNQTISDTPLTKLVKEKVKPNRSLRAWEIVLLILGFPLWFPLLIAAFSVCFAFYVTIWSLIIALWSIELALVISSLGSIFAAVVVLFQGYALSALLLLGAGLFCAGLSVFCFFGCLKATKGILKLTKKIALGVKSLFIKKEGAK